MKNKKFNKAKIQRQVADLATDYIKEWTEHQLKQIQIKEPVPVCVPLNDGYRVGRYRLKVHKNHTCDVFDHNSELVHTFDNKISAILYSVYTLRRRYQTANEILLWDTEINKKQTDLIFYRKSIARGRQQKDYFSVDVAQARLEVAEAQLAHARNNLLNLCKTAKYNKIWEQKS